MTPFLAPALAGIGIGTVISAGFLRDLVFAWRSKYWPSTQGRVIEWGVDLGGLGRSEDNSALIGYQYEVRGVKYTSRRIDYAGRGAGRNAGYVLERYSQGQAVAVRYDPSEPSRAVLETGVTLGNFLRVVFGLAVIGLGVLLLLAS